MHTMRYNRKPKKYEGIFGFYIDRNFFATNSYFLNSFSSGR